MRNASLPIAYLLWEECVAGDMLQFWHGCSNSSSLLPISHLAPTQAPYSASDRRFGRPASTSLSQENSSRVRRHLNWPSTKLGVKPCKWPWEDQLRTYLLGHTALSRFLLYSWLCSYSGIWFVLGISSQEKVLRHRTTWNMPVSDQTLKTLL